MPIPLGAHSPKLAEVRQLLTKRGRSGQRRFAFEGATLLGEALSSGVQPEAVYASEEAFRALERDGLAERLDQPVYLLAERALRRISDLDEPPGIVAVARQRLLTLDDLLGSGEPVLLLAGVADPGNAGTLLRSAEIFGVGCVLFGGDAVEPYNSKVVRASMGAIFRLRLAVASPGEVLAAASSHGYAIVAAGRGGVAARDFDFPDRMLMAVGSERHGVAGWLPYWDETVSIPHAGIGESLNAAVAGSIILYEFSQRAGRRPSDLSTRKRP
jgi:TrmH family RNA methyltransferase